MNKKTTTTAITRNNEPPRSLTNRAVKEPLARSAEKNTKPKQKTI